MAVSTVSRQDVLASINITPLIDVMLVLLVIFMVTAKLGDRDAVPLDLPSAASGQTVQRIVAITVAADGTRTVDGARHDDDAALRSLLRERHARTPDLRCVIEASRRASHGDVMRALDSVRLAGIAKVAFAVERE